MQNNIKDVLLSRANDLASVLDGGKARRAVEEILDEAGCSPEEMSEFWSDPETTLGPFGDLPDKVREGLAEAAGFSFVEGNSLSSPRLIRTVHGPRSRLGYRLIRLGWLLMYNWRFKGGKFLVRLGRKMVTSARARGRVLLKRIRLTDQYRLPLVYALWIRCECDVLALIQDYIKDIPVDRRLSPVWRSEDHFSESNMIIGIDTIMHGDKVYFVETNLNPGFHADRMTLFPGGDPVCRNMVKYAAEKGYARIVFCPANVVSSFVDTSYLLEVELEESWRAIAAEKNIRLEVVDSPVLGSPYDRKADMFMSEEARDTLYVNVRDLHSPISRLLGTKGKLEALLAVRNRDLPEADQIWLPREINNDQELPSLDIAPGFPNVIVKDRRLDRAQGIVMYRCSTLPEGVNQGTRQAFEYVVPNRERLEVDGVVGEFVYVFRTHVLLTPEGPRYLAIRKDISSVPVPAALDEGTVDNKKAFISNLHLGSYSVLASEAENSAHERFCLSVGGVLCDLLRQKHRTLIQ